MFYFDPFETRSHGEYPDSLPADSEGYLWPDMAFRSTSFGSVEEGNKVNPVVAAAPSLGILAIAALGLWYVFKK